jgi:predicted nucleic acid-binding protein
MIYLDTSALVELIRREPESDALADWLDARPSTPWVSSMLVEAELPRALRRTEPALLADVPATVARVARYEIDEVVRAAVAAYPDPHHLRSLDAIHLATARSIFGRQLTAFVSYDRRLLAAAATWGLPLDSPGLGSWWTRSSAGRAGDTAARQHVQATRITRHQGNCASLTQEN